VPWGKQLNFHEDDDIEEDIIQDKSDIIAEGTFKVFALEVQFLMEKFKYKEQAKRTEQLMSFATHPRLLAGKTLNQKGASG
jgi:hypothetical protein